MKEYVTSEQIKDEIGNRQDILDKLQDYDKIVVITRGGMGVAAILSQFLDIRWFDTVCVSSYSDEKKQEKLDLIKINPTDEKVLLVEDLIDTGATWKLLKPNFPNGKIFALHYKPTKSVIKPDYYLWETDKWVVYPWERG